MAGGILRCAKSIIMSSADSTISSIMGVAKRFSVRNGKQRRTLSIGTTGRAGIRLQSMTLLTLTKRGTRSKVPFLLQCSPMASGALPHFNISIPSRPRPRWRGSSFALHPDTVQGFLFARIQYSRIQAFTACFAVSMQLYHQRHKTAHRALQRLFLRLQPFNRPRYQTDTSGYNTTCATLEGIHAPGRAQPIPDTTATPGRCTGQHSRLL